MTIQHVPFVVRRPRDIDTSAWMPVAGCPGVDYVVLWRQGDFVHSLVRYRQGAHSAGFPHHAAYHHLWIVSGDAWIAGQHVTAGTYLTVPPGAEHPVHDVGPDGCLMLQIHRPLGLGEPGVPSRN
jgi:mannose-6-phosphate isomerase-like protein (cupin superfamily)